MLIQNIQPCLPFSGSGVCSGAADGVDSAVVVTGTTVVETADASVVDETGAAVVVVTGATVLV